MAREPIPVDTTGVTPKVAFGMVNDMTLELYNNIATASAGATSAAAAATAANTAATNAAAASQTAITNVAAASATATAAQTAANNAAAAAAAAQSTANSAASNASTAITTANGIAGTANTALSNANAAQTTANAASTNASAALTSANNVAATAAAAQTTANTANTNANNAVTTANAVANTANTANTNANTAISTANAVSATANTALTNAAAAQTSATTANTNASNAVSTANAISATANTALTTANAASTLANTFSGLTGSQRVLLSTWPGIDPTGVADSWAAFSAALTACMAAGKPLIIDCPVFLNISTDVTKVLFLLDGCAIYGEPSGKIMYNNVGLPLFELFNIRNCRLSYVNFQYVGIGVPINQQTVTIPTGQPGAGTTYYANSGSFNTTTMTNFMKNSTNPNIKTTFKSGSTSSWSGDSSLYACIHFDGDCQGVQIIGCSFTVAPGTNAAYFLPEVFGFQRNWKPDATRPGGVGSPAGTVNLTTADYMQITKDVNIIDCYADGIQFFALGDGAYNIHGLVARRYTDTQNPDGSNVGGTPATSPNWPPPHLIYTNDLDSSYTNYNAWSSAIAYALNQQVSYGGTWWQASQANTNQTPAAGSAYWTNISPGPAGMPNPWTRNISDVVDYGPFCGGPVRRYGSSGPIGSLKLSLTAFTMCTNYSSYRADGGADFLSAFTGASNGMGANFQFTFDSRTVAGDGGHFYGFRHPASQPYTGFKIHGIKCRDMNPAPTYTVWTGMGNSGNYGNEVLNMTLELADFVGGNSPGFALGGNDMTLTGTLVWDQFSNTNQHIAVTSQASSILIDSDVRLVGKGFRRYPMTFSAAPTGTTVLNMTAFAGGTTFPFSTGVYEVWFIPTNNSSAMLRRWAKITTGASPTVDWTAVNSGDGRSVAASTYGLTAYLGGLYQVMGVGNYANRMNIVGTGGGSSGNYIEFDDKWNRYKQVVDGYSLDELWQLEGNFTPPAQSAVGWVPMPGIVIPTGWSLVKADWHCQTGLGTANGLTGVYFGSVGTPQSLNGSVAYPTTLPITSNSVPNVPAYAPFVPTASGQMGLTSIGGTGFDGTGSVNVTIVMKRTGATFS